MLCWRCEYCTTIQTSFTCLDTVARIVSLYMTIWNNTRSGRWPSPPAETSSARWTPSWRFWSRFWNPTLSLSVTMTHCTLTVSGTSVRKYNHLLHLTCMLARSFLVDLYICACLDMMVSTSYLFKSIIYYIYYLYIYHLPSTYNMSLANCRHRLDLLVSGKTNQVINN